MEITAEGATLQEVFAEAALAVFAAAVDPASVGEGEVREVRAHGDSLKALLLHWIGECLYVHEVEGFACRRLDFAVFDTGRAGGEPLRLHAFLRGETMDPARHQVRSVVKGVWGEQAVIEEMGGRVRVHLGLRI